MAETKRYYWLKLPTDFFEDKAIKRLRQIAGGDTYTIIYLKMLLKSLEDNGKLYYEGIEDTISEEIALDINESVDDVQVAINYLVKKGLMIVTENEAELLRMNEMIGSETDVARRVRKHRKLQSNSNLLQSNTTVTKCNTDIDIDIDKEIEKDNKTKKQKSKNLLIEEYTDNEELRLSLQAFVEMRKTIKKPLTDYAMKLALNSLTKLASDDDTKIMIVNNSVQNSWQGFYGLKNQSTVPSYMGRQKNGEIHDTKPSKEALERAKALQESLKA